MSDINLKINKKTAKWLIAIIGLPSGGYLSYDKLWEPYKQIQMEKSVEFIHEMQMTRFEIQRLIYEAHVNTLVNAGYEYDIAIELANEAINGE